MRMPLVVSSLVAVTLAGCVPPAGTARRGAAEYGAAPTNLVSVPGGRFETAVAFAELTYVVDTTTGLCFAIADRIQGGSLGAEGMTPVDCCALRNVVPAGARAWSAALRCDGPPAAPAPPAPPAA